MLCTLLLSALLLPAVDDLIPTAIEELLAQPQDEVFFGVQDLLDGETAWTRSDQAGARCLLSLDDFDQDGQPEVALGLGPGSGPRPLRVLRGSDGSLLWAASAGEGFRSLRGLAYAAGRLAAAPSSVGGRLAVYDAASGTQLWARDVLPGSNAETTLHSVRWIEDRDDDAVAELLVSVGGPQGRFVLLSGADGATIWTHLSNDVSYDAIEIGDRNGDGLAEVAAVGGEAAPFAALLNGSDGTPLWSVPLGGPGSVVLELDDRDDDGWPELAVGMFNEPGECLISLDGASGELVWSATGVTRGVTTLLLLQDLVGTGLRDIAVGSFDNALSAVLSFNGVSQWRRETTTNNGGQVLSIARVGDLDGNGVDDVAGAAMDRRVWVVESSVGQYLGVLETTSRGHVVASDVDRDGDGRPEFLLGDARGTSLVRGNLGLANGPLVLAEQGENLIEPISLELWTLPSTRLILLAAAAPGAIPTKYGPLGLDPSSMVLLLNGTAPGAGVGKYIIPSLPPAASGVRLYFQTVCLYADETYGLLSNVASELVP